MNACVEGNKRQLPPWMMQKVGASATATHVSDSVETNSSTKKGDIIKANATKKDTHKSEPSNLRAKCEVKGRKKLDQQEGKVTQKKRKGDKSKDRDKRSSIKKRKKLEDPSHGCYDVNPVRDDAMDLTVEDLMAIAEQYVKDYENKDRKERSSRQRESKWQFQDTNETGTTLDSSCENRISSGSGREDLSNSTSTTGELIATSTSQTGDPAQDMLDLFLGPLLRKTLEKEKIKSVVENAKITHEFSRQSQDKLAGEEMVPLMKKRNTLKDKVAMFLDQDM
ncbi:uncharacterized protein LOC114374792 [Glycine soja]|nr:uncharacterized protein LOC114374792 [Glycine soja]XP_028188285.1 uncharacterized protein LOC114374792 [Glycine soja]XP_040862617.1 uncharacterized protein LOC106795167 [Glycine max]